MQIMVARESYVQWLSFARDLSPHTIRAYNADILAFERHLGAGLGVGAIDRACLLTFIEHQREMGLSVVSIRRRASALRGFCRWLRSRDLIEDDPALGLSLPAGRARQLPRDSPSIRLPTEVLTSTGWVRLFKGFEAPSSALYMLGKPSWRYTAPHSVLSRSAKALSTLLAKAIQPSMCSTIDSTDRNLRCRACSTSPNLWTPRT
jgi:hypothetical protein